MTKINFPKIGNKEHLSHMFSAQQWIGKSCKIPPNVLFIYSAGFHNLLIHLFEFRKNLELCDKDMWKRKTMITADNKLFVIEDAIGAPSTAAAMEKAIVCGGKNFLILGRAGGLGSDVRLNDIVLCSKAIRDEGTSHHYINSSKYVMPTKSLTSELAKKMLENGIKFSKGPTWTTDAIFAETKKEVRKYSDEGVLTVDMEAAAMFAVAKKRNVNASAAFVVSDILNKDMVKGAESYEELARIAEIFKNNFG